MTTIEKIEAYLLISITEDFKPNVQEYIDAVTSYIERYTGRNFTADTEATVRLYDGTGDSEIYIDDAVEITEVTIDGNIVTDFTLYPSNRLPKTRIILKTQNYTRGNQNISVTAKWGYGSEAPADLAFAATVMASGIVNSQNTDEKDIQSESIGRYSVTFRQDSSQSHDLQNAKDILKLYKRYI